MSFDMISKPYISAAFTLAIAAVSMILFTIICLATSAVSLSSTRVKY